MNIGHWFWYSLNPMDKNNFNIKQSTGEIDIYRKSYF